MAYSTIARASLALSLTLLGACSNGDAANAAEDNLSETARASVVAALALRALPAGTGVVVSLDNTISSRDRSAGDPFTAQVLKDATDAKGTVIIPMGAVVRGTITAVSSASNIKSTGTLTLAVSSVIVDGKTYLLDASIGSLETTEEGRGIEKADGARVAGGAVAGAILGRVIGGDKKGTIIGAAAGAVTGAAVSATVKDTDIVLPAGSRMTLTLNEPLIL